MYKCGDNMKKGNSLHSADFINEKKKIVFIAPKTSTFLNFRGQLLKDCADKGYEVVAIVPEDELDEKFKELNTRKVVLNFNKSSLSIFGTLNYLKGLSKILKEEQPDKVFSYTIKPVIFG